MGHQGAMTFGAPGKEGARVHDLKGVNAILDVFQKHGHEEVCLLSHLSLYSFLILMSTRAKVDTARGYTGGTSEEYLGEVHLSEYNHY